EDNALFRSTSRPSVSASISRHNTSSGSQSSSSHSTDPEGAGKSDSLALQVTKEAVRAHWMARRAGAFSTPTKPVKEPLHHTDLLGALKSGLIRRVSTSGDSKDPEGAPVPKQKAEETPPPPLVSGAGLVGYEDSD
ncbi:unnamed protein product, partial [Dibothriocephalus latus]